MAVGMCVLLNDSHMRDGVVPWWMIPDQSPCRPSDARIVYGFLYLPTLYTWYYAWGTFDSFDGLICFFLAWVITGGDSPHKESYTRKSRLCNIRTPCDAQPFFFAVRKSGSDRQNKNKTWPTHIRHLSIFPSFVCPFYGYIKIRKRNNNDCNFF